jgi:hypothetical protein
MKCSYEQRLSKFNHGFETRSAPVSLAATFAALPSVSLLPAAPLTDETDAQRMTNAE